METNVKVRVYSIEWETDGDMDALNSLPTTLELEIEQPDDDDEIDEYLIGSLISDMTGFLHNGFEFEYIEK